MHPLAPGWAAAYKPKLLIPLSPKAICSIQAGKVLRLCHPEAPGKPPFIPQTESEGLGSDVSAPWHRILPCRRPGKLKKGG